MGNRHSYNYATYEDIQSKRYVLINTLPLKEQMCLIKDTIIASLEEDFINTLISNSTTRKPIIIYGKNYMDESVYKKYDQLDKLGFSIKIYVSGMFEWMLLQEIYGNEYFPTTSKELDILKFRPQHQQPVNHTADISSSLSDVSLRAG